MSIRPLTPADAPAFHALRQRALREEPTAFLASAEEPDEHLAELTQRIERQSSLILGAWEGGDLVGSGGLFRETRLKVRHKAVIWGMYVRPESRRRGYARALLRALWDAAQLLPRLWCVRLSVVADQAAARELYAAEGFEEERTEIGAIHVDGELYDEIHLCRWIEGAPLRSPTGPRTDGPFPPFVVHYRAVPEREVTYPAPFDQERFGWGRDLAAAAGTRGLGVYRDRVPPGRRLSRLHAHSLEEELVLVAEGHPRLYYRAPGEEGKEVQLEPGHMISFPAGSGIAHTFVNRSRHDAVLLVVGERREGDRVRYPEDPAFSEWVKERRPARYWEEE